MPVSASSTRRASRFVAPPPPSSYVARPHLDARLNEAVRSRLTVVSGRAGCGKSALVANWMTTIDERDRAWITLSDNDNAAPVFWNSVEAALRHFGELRFDQFRRMSVQRDAFLALDDVQVLTSEDGRNSLADLVALVPQWMHLIVMCREQPALSLWRLRAAGDLTEIGDEDLQFSLEETTRVLEIEEIVDVDAVGFHTRTDGWITGLKLMTAAHRACRPPVDDIREFLFEEVFAPHTASVQRFLMETACLTTLSPVLCAHVTGRADSAELLRQLERSNVFVTRDPDEYGRYRYQPQFRAMLRDELDARDPDRARAIHAAAARWHQERDDPAAAVEHWLAAGNLTDAARLFPEARFSASDANRDELVRALLANIHPSMGATDVWHLLDYATALVGVDELIASNDVLDHVDAILQLDPDAPATFRAAMLRALLRVGSGDVEGMVVQLERAAAILDAKPTLARDRRLETGLGPCQLQIWLGHGYRWLERPREARRALQRLPLGAIDRRDIHFRDSARAAAAFASGRLREASEWATCAIERAHQLGEGGDVTVRAAHHVYASLLRERNELAAARTVLDALAQSVSGPPTGVFAVRTRLAQAELLRAEGNPSESLEILLQMRHDSARAPSAAVDRWIARSTMLCLLAIGRTDAARTMLGSPPFPGGLSSTAALLELADGQPDAAERHAAVMRVDTPRRLLTASLVRARIAAARGDEPQVEHHLRRALRIGSRERFVRTIGEIAPDLVGRFPILCRTPDEADYVLRLRLATNSRLGIIDGEGTGASETRLSTRELEVLTYLPTQLSARDIALALHVSLNTVKTHMHNVYRKLDSDSRATAVERARVLRLLR